MQLACDTSARCPNYFPTCCRSNPSEGTKYHFNANLIAGYALAENGTVTLNGDSAYISGCPECREYSSGETLSRISLVDREARAARSISICPLCRQTGACFDGTPAVLVLRRGRTGIDAIDCTDNVRLFRPVNSSNIDFVGRCRLSARAEKGSAVVQARAAPPHLSSARFTNTGAQVRD